jgi:hypothetical protein
MPATWPDDFVDPNCQRCLGEAIIYGTLHSFPGGIWIKDPDEICACVGELTVIAGDWEPNGPPDFVRYRWRDVGQEIGDNLGYWLQNERRSVVATHLSRDGITAVVEERVQYRDVVKP